MKIDSKEFIKLSFLYTAVAALPPFLNLVVRPLIEGNGKLNPADFSQIEIAETFTSLAFIIASFAMNNAISRFYYDHKENPSNLHKLISGIFNSILLRGSVVFILAFLFKDYIGNIFTQPELRNFSSYGFLAITIGLSRAINVTAFALYRNEKRVRRYIILGFMLGLLRSGAQIIGVLYYNMSFVGYLYGSAIGSGAVSIIILYFVYKKSGFHYSWSFLRPANQYAFPLFEYTFVAWGITFADRYFLEGSPVILAIYGQALLMGKGVEIILQGMQGASQPEIFRLMKIGVQKTADHIKELSHLLMAQSQLLIAVAIIPAMLYCLLFKTNLRLAAGLITIILVRYILRVQYIIFSIPVYYEKKTKFFLYLNLAVLFVNLILLYFLVPVWKAYGAITAVMVSQGLQVIGVYIYQKSIINISWNLNKLLIYPFAIIIFAIGLEGLKIIFDLNIFATAIPVVFAIFGSLTFLYRNEIKNIVSKRWKQFS